MTPSQHAENLKRAGAASPQLSLVGTCLLRFWRFLLDRPLV